MTNLELPVSLTCMSFDCGKTWREDLQMHGEHVNSTHDP